MGEQDITEDIEIEDGHGLKRYRTEIPNIVYELGLSPFELALYCHLKRAAGGNSGGICWKGTRTLAAETGMSIGMVCKAKAALEGKRKELGNRALISTKSAEGKSDRITILDIWGLNFQHFDRSPGDTHRSPHEHYCSPHEHTVHQVNERKNPLRKNKEEGTHRKDAGAPEADKPFSVDSPNGKAILAVCKKTTLVISPKDHQSLVYVLKGLPPGVAVADIEAFGRKCKGHWIGKEHAPSIMQVLEHWGDVMELPEPGEKGVSKNGKSDTGYTTAKEYLAARNAKRPDG